MKKLLIVLLSLAMVAVCFCSCNFSSTSAKGVQGKTFVYSSCPSAVVKTGTETDFYTEENLAGSTKDAVITTIVNRLYGHGTSDKTGELSFESTPCSGYTYNGKDTKVYEFNHTDISEYEVTNGGYYVNLDSGFTSIQFLEAASGSRELKDRVFDCGTQMHSTVMGDVVKFITNSVSAVATSVTYNASAKQLTVVMDVTYSVTDDDSTTTNAMTYTLLFNEK